MSEPTTKDYKVIDLDKNTMSSINFLYWIQGLFELGQIQVIKAEQVKIIKEHLRITSKDHPFVSWLEGFLETQSRGVNKKLTLVIKNKLEMSFKNITKTSEIKGSLEDLLTTRPRSSGTPQGSELWRHLTAPVGPLIC